MVSLNVTINWYELKTIHATKTGKGAFSSSLVFQNSEHPRIGYFVYKKLSFDRLNVFFFFDTNKKILVLVGLTRKGLERWVSRGADLR